MLRSLSIAAGVAAIGTVALAESRWRQISSRAIDALENPATTNEGRDLDESHGDASILPASVERYLEFALGSDARRARGVRLLQIGTMRAKARDPWHSFRAREALSMRPAGFVWDASMRVAPFLSIRVRDGYIAGVGFTEAAFASLLPLGTLPRSPEVTSASLLRYLAETPWLPTALLPRDGLSWTALDNGRARATLCDRDTSATMDVDFGDAGEIATVSAMRYRDCDGKAVCTPWIGRYAEYARIDGMMIPLRAEVSWRPPEGEFVAWRGRIVRADYRFVTAHSHRILSAAFG